MADPTPPVAPAAVPEAVRTAIREAEETAVALAERRSGQTEIDYDCAHTAMEKAIVTALRAAAETRDQEIARLTAELAAAKEDTARLDWMERRCGGQAPVTEGEAPYWHYGVSADCPASLRAMIDPLMAFDAARAAGEETR